MRKERHKEIMKDIDNKKKSKKEWNEGEKTEAREHEGEEAMSTWMHRGVEMVTYLKEKSRWKKRKKRSWKEGIGKSEWRERKRKKESMKNMKENKQRTSKANEHAEVIERWKGSQVWKWRRREMKRKKEEKVSQRKRNRMKEREEK